MKWNLGMWGVKNWVFGWMWLLALSTPALPNCAPPRNGRERNSISCNFSTWTCDRVSKAIYGLPSSPVLGEVGLLGSEAPTAPTPTCQSHETGDISAKVCVSKAEMQQVTEEVGPQFARRDNTGEADGWALRIRESNHVWQRKLSTEVRSIQAPLFRTLSKLHQRRQQTQMQDNSQRRMDAATGSKSGIKKITKRIQKKCSRSKNVPSRKPAFNDPKKTIQIDLAGDCLCSYHVCRIWHRQLVRDSFQKCFSTWLYIGMAWHPTWQSVFKIMYSNYKLQFPASAQHV